MSKPSTSVSRRIPSISRYVALFAVAALAASAGLATGGADRVAAHAALIRADPPVNSQLREPPDSFVLFFSEPLEKRFSSIRVTDATGARLDERVEFDASDPSQMRVILKAKPEPGFLTVIWENVSTVDGHRISGSYPLTILNPDGSLPPGQPAQADSGSVTGTEVEPARVAAKWLLLIAGSVVTGSLAFLFAVGERLPAAMDAPRQKVWANAIQVALFGTCLLMGAGAAEIINQAADIGSQSAMGMLLLAAGAVAVGLALGLGLRTLVHPVGDERSSRLMTTVSLIYLVVTGLLLGGGIGAALGQGSEPGPSGFSNLGTVALRTEWGERWLIRNALLLPLLALLLLIWRPRAVRLRIYPLAGALLLSVGFLLITSSVSHAAAVPMGSAWSIAADFVHLLAASVWTGMLLQLAMFLIWARTNLIRSERPAVVASALQRFSVVAVASVSLLLFSGVVSGSVQLENVNDLLETAYGRTLLLKLLLVAGLLVIAGINAYVFRPMLVARAESDDGRRVSESWVDTEARLGAYARRELVLVALVFLVVAVLTQVAPPTAGRDTNAVSTGKFTATKEESGIGATLVVDPNEPGENTFEVYLTGGVDAVEQVRLTFLDPNGFASRLPLDSSNPPTFYVGRGAFLSMAGKWTIRLDILRTRGSDLTLPFELQVGSQASPPDGGDLSAPFPTSQSTLILLGASGLVAIAVVIGSLPRKGRPAGLIGQAGVALLRVHVPPLLSLALFLSAGLGLVLAADQIKDRALSPEQASRGNPVDSSPASIERGRILFNRNCIQCHGETGRGDGELARSLPIPPANLYDHIPYHPDQFFFGVLTNGLSGIMPAFGSTLSEDDRWDVMNFLRDQFGQPPADR